MSGKRDRPAHFEIDQKTLEYKKPAQKKQEDGIDPPQKVAQRTFYKIKVPGSQNREAPSSKTNFQLFPNNQASPAKHTEPEKPKEQQNKEPKQNSQQPKKQDTKEEVKKDEQKKSGIFGFPSNGQGIFSNGVGIFTNSNSIFSKTNIFAKKDPIVQSNTIGDVKPSNSIFGSSQSIFNFANNGVPPIKKQVLGQKPDQQEEDGGGDSEELEKDQKLQIDRTKSTGKFQYKSECQTLFQHKALKVKKNNGQIVENVEVIVQQDSTKVMSWVTIRLAATKHAILTGHLVKEKSQAKKIGNKDENVTLSIFVRKDKARECHILKLQFEKPEQGKNFLEVVEKLIK